MQTYTGSLTISWTTTYTDSEGHRHTQHHTQTLHASVDKPMPDYSEYTRLIYGNDAAPDLVFSHSPSHAEKLNEKQLERRVKSGAKEIQKLQKEQIKAGGSNVHGNGQRGIRRTVRRARQKQRGAIPSVVYAARAKEHAITYAEQRRVRRRLCF